MLILYEIETETRAKVTGINNPHETLPQHIIDSGIIVEDYPKPERRFGKASEMFINPLTKEMWIEYTDRPLTQEEKITKMEETIAALTGIVEVLING